MEIDLVSMLFFVFGMIVQSLFMVGAIWEKENLKKNSEYFSYNSCFCICNFDEI